MSTDPLLATKTELPLLQAKRVMRPRLVEALNAATSAKLTLVSAPAGYGKTTLVASWAAQQPEKSIAWMWVDGADNNPTRFLAYIVASVQAAGVAVSIDPHDLLSAPRALPFESVITTLINDVAEDGRDISLVIDDFHCIEDPDIQQGVGFLVEHLPARMHLVIATRADPSLPMARLRGRGQVNEFRATDLRFTDGESATLIQEVFGIELDDRHVAQLNTRAEGWIAGLQMASVSMQRVDDVPRFVEDFAGDHRYIFDFLVDEVLQRCNDEARSFLLETSVLDRLSAPLCDFVTGRRDSAVMLGRLVRDNLFILPLDHRGEWYRYHHLFAEVMRHRLAASDEGREEKLHSNASEWWQENGSIEDAIRHALAMKDKNRVADLLEESTGTLVRQGRARVEQLHSWFRQLPDTLYDGRPLLWCLLAHVLSFVGPTSNRDRIEYAIDQARNALTRMDPDAPMARLVTGHTLVFRAAYSAPPLAPVHDSSKVVKSLLRAKELFTGVESGFLADTSIGIGYEYLNQGAAEKSIDENREAAAIATTAGSPLLAAVATRNEAFAVMQLGRLGEAKEMCQAGLADSGQAAHNGAAPTSGLLRSLLGYLHVEIGELEEAGKELGAAVESIHLYGEYEARCLAHMALLRLHLLRGDCEAAAEAVDSIPEKPLFADLAKTLSAQCDLSRPDAENRLPALHEWIDINKPHSRSPSDFPGISPWSETQHLAQITWIRSQLLLHETDNDAGSDLLQFCQDHLDGYAQFAASRRLTPRLIELLVMKAIVANILGQRSAGDAAMAEALELAESIGLRRVFLDKGFVTREMLERTAGSTTTHFATELVAHIPTDCDNRQSTPIPGMAEPLSPREMAVLELVADGLSNREIGERLFVALDTVKGHNRRIFAKLEVANRLQAVKRAVALEILPGTGKQP